VDGRDRCGMMIDNGKNDELIHNAEHHLRELVNRCAELAYENNKLQEELREAERKRRLLEDHVKMLRAEEEVRSRAYWAATKG